MIKINKGEKVLEPLVKKEAPFIYFHIPAWEKLDQNLKVGFSSRHGGTSAYPFQTMNLALHVGDNQETVIDNRKTLSHELGFSFDAWTAADQVHGNHIAIVNMEDKGKGSKDLQTAIQAADGMVTNEKGILLTSYYADCTPLLFFDPVKKVIGLAHAGWKGTVLKIGAKMIETMVKEFGSNVNNILVTIGPAIDQCCYEVNDQVINPLKKSLSFIPLEMIVDKKNGHFDLNLKKANEQILIEAGILPNNIEISSYCTSCDNDLFFSYRREKGSTGRMASWIGFRKDE